MIPTDSITPPHPISEPSQPKSKSRFTDLYEKMVFPIFGSDDMSGEPSICCSENVSKRDGADLESSLIEVIDQEVTNIPPEFEIEFTKEDDLANRENACIPYSSCSYSEEESLSLSEIYLILLDDEPVTFKTSLEQAKELLLKFSERLVVHYGSRYIPDVEIGEDEIILYGRETNLLVSYSKELCKLKIKKIRKL
jgi:hypothetical protein